MEVPEVDAVVDEFRRRLDPRQAEGVPAHVTVLYPFVPAESLDEQLLRELPAVFASVRPFRARFSQCAWFGTDVLWLAPDDDRPFRLLTRAAAAAYPEHPPYGGEFEDPIPHLTVADRADLAAMQEAERRLGDLLPIEADVTAVSLLEQQPGGRWVRRARILPSQRRS